MILNVCLFVRRLGCLAGMHAGMHCKKEGGWQYMAQLEIKGAVLVRVAFRFVHSHMESHSLEEHPLSYHNHRLPALNLIGLCPLTGAVFLASYLLDSPHLLSSPLLSMPLVGPAHMQRLRWRRRTSVPLVGGDSSLRTTLIASALMEKKLIFSINHYHLSLVSFSNPFIRLQTS